MRIRNLQKVQERREKEEECEERKEEISAVDGGYVGSNHNVANAGYSSGGANG